MYRQGPYCTTLLTPVTVHSVVAQNPAPGRRRKVRRPNGASLFLQVPCPLIYVPTSRLVNEVVKPCRLRRSCRLRRLRWVVGQCMRQELDPRGAVFMDFVGALCRGSAASTDMRLRVAQLLEQAGTCAKLVMRKLTSAVLPSGCKQKRAFIRDVLRINVASTWEQSWTTTDCLLMLHAVSVRVPHCARIPLNLRTRVRPTKQHS